MTVRTIHAADLFCGAGGITAGTWQACQEMGYRLELVAVNHWERAIQTHMANFPQFRHICASLTPIEPRQTAGTLWETGTDGISPRKAVPSGKLDHLAASPECTNHSNAKGSKPRSEQSRATPWCILRWAEALRPESILIENVPEFQKWGPLDDTGHPVKAREGDTFRAFLQAVDSLGYAVAWRVLNTADYGDPTCRRRMFIAAIRGRASVRWPDATHSRNAEHGLPCWRAAREVLDFRKPSQSIFDRPEPLKPKTIERIAYGLRKFGGKAAEPFLVMLYGTGKARSIDRPMPTVTAQGNHIALVQPFITAIAHTSGGPRAYSVEAPIPCITGTRTFALIEPYVVKYNRTGRAKSIGQPLDTISTKPRFGLVEPVALIGADGRDYGLDILYRMVQPDELAAAMSFPPDYWFAGTKDEQVRQIGNAVPIRTACQLTKALLRETA
jgi:DNA (cytosine-5)-methyltransferase 1